MGTLHFAPSAQMTTDEKIFFQALGARVASLRKERDLTQQQLAELLGVSQQVVASYEVGRRRIPVSLLSILAKALGVSVETMLGENEKLSGKRGPVPKIQQQLERLSQLPRAKQRFVMDMLDTVLQQQAG